MRLVCKLALLSLLVVPGAALADPVSMIAAASAWLGTTAIVVAGVAVSWGAIVFAGASILYGQAQARRAARDANAAAAAARDSYNNSLRDRTVSGIATEFPERTIYGASRVGGNVVALFSSGDRDQYKHVIAILAQHESQSIDEIWIAGQALGPLSADGQPLEGVYTKESTVSSTETFWTPTFTLSQMPAGGALSIVGGVASNRRIARFTQSGQSITINEPGLSGPYVASYQITTASATIRVTKHLGTPGDPVDAATHSETGGAWPATAVLTGHTYLAIRFDLDQAEFQGGLPAIEALVSGKKLLDLRNNVTQWSENPALVIYDYLVNGCNIASSKIPLATFITAANDCDDFVANAGFYGKRYTFNGPVTTEASQEETLERMAQAMAGGIVGNTWNIYAGKFSAPVMGITQSDIIGQVAMSPGLPLNAVYNTVKGQYVGASNGYVATDFPPYVNATYRAFDGEGLDTNIDFPFTNDPQRCHNLARIFTEDSRNGFAINGRFSLRTWRLRIGDRVSFTSSVFGHNGKVFRVTDKSFAPNQGVLLGLKEDAASIYDLADAVVVDSTLNTNLPNPFAIDKIEFVGCQSGDDELIIGKDGSIVSRIMAFWPQAKTLAVVSGGLIDVEYQLMGAADWVRVQVAGDQTSVHLSPVKDGEFYLVRVRAFNPYFNVKSDWTYATLHQVVGKTAPPDDVVSMNYSFEQNGIRLSWPNNSDLDISDYLLRVGGATWEVATELTTTTATEYLWRVQVSGTLRVWIKARDTSGNLSLNAFGKNVIVLGPGAVTVYHDIVGADEVLNWTIPTSGFTVDRYELRYGETFELSVFVDSTKAQGYRRAADYAGERRWWVLAIDVAGNRGTPGLVIGNVTPPGPVWAMRIDVVDNNSLIYWSPPTVGILPVNRYEVRRGWSWESSEVIGSNGNSTFTTFFEQTSGTYTYWISAVDSAGNFGPAKSDTAIINQPPDYVLSANINSTLQGYTENAARQSDGSLILPVNTSEDWAAHFDGNGWATPEQQVMAGFPIYIQPTEATATYIEYIDYGAVLPVTQVSVALNAQVIAGAVDYSIQVSTRLTPTENWSGGGTGTEVNATNFRYARVVVTFTAAAGRQGLMAVNSLNIKLSTKRRQDNGEGTAPPGGIFVPFNYNFIAAETPIVQPNGGTPLIPVVIFVGSSNPTGFTVKLYNLAGVDVGGFFSWQVRGY